MNNKINLSQLVELFAQASGMSRAASEQFVKSFFDMISQNVISDEIVKVKGLGTFKLLRMEDRESVNVNTGERFVIEGHQKISFTPDAELKEFINKPFSAFGTVIITDEQAQVLEEMNTPGQTDTDDELRADSDETLLPDNPAVEPALEEAVEPAPENEPVQEDNPESKETPVIVVLDKQEQEGNKTSEVKEITQKRSTRFLLRGAVTLLSVVLVAGVGLFLFWPLIGVKVLNHFDNTNTAMVVKETPKPASAKPVNVQSQAKPAVQTETEIKPEPKQEAVVEPKQEVKEEPKPEAKVEPKQEAKVEPKQEAKAVSNPATTAFFELNAADQAKELSEYSVADTVNYSITGFLVEHVMEKNETLTSIALKYYGSKKLWPYIAKYNNLVNFNRMRPGDRIKVPKLGHK